MKYALKEPKTETDLVINSLKTSLADTYTLLLKTHTFHWNVTGSQFYNLHLLFEKQYNELVSAADKIAERIRALGYYAPGGLRTYASMTSIEDPKEDLSADDMLRSLIADYEKLTDGAKSGINIAIRDSDDATANLLTDLLQEQQKQAWMLQSSLKNEE